MAALQHTDGSIARFGPAVRQCGWRDELLKSGIRGKGGQMIHFSRVDQGGTTRPIQNRNAEKKKSQNPHP
jgi:adenine-specific DNA-methyltransferase